MFILGDNHNMVLLISIWYLFKYMIIWIVWNPFNDDNIDVSSGNLVFAENWRLQGFWGGFDDRNLFKRELLCLLPRVLKRLRASAPNLSLKYPNIRHDYFFHVFFLQNVSPSSWKGFPFSWTCEKPVWRRYPTENENVVSYF